MTENQEYIQMIKQSLSKWGEERILVIKEENGDTDQTMLNLERVDIGAEFDPIDDYGSDQSLQLVGRGQTLFENHQAALPYQSYDIPIENIYDVSVNQKRITIQTDRGMYTITPV
ncbi:hypothetical protein EV207_1133 [Scopulibacillus darangshiensis]|uniref:Uncharacterized protein n=1 Tax=Scopulibacillus darangshiensis TaxID=442528 RepID=A0A4R2P2Q3_9BACL|nr:hypothetical protein [Scopulibacillus darangshiensis]TCP28970.1 hypothetical protein EV207_1133 [Scopulibacillus darangshiensis]